jgi:hypothetical protein
VNISQLIKHPKACVVYEDFPKQGKLLTKKLMMQGYNGFGLNHNFANSMVTIMTLFAITNHH